MPSPLLHLLEPFLLPIPDGSTARQIHFLNPTSHFVLTVMSLACLFAACLTAWAWHSTEQRRIWFEAETERRRALAREAKDEMSRQVQEVSEEMERLTRNVQPLPRISEEN